MAAIHAPRQRRPTGSRRADRRGGGVSGSREVTGRAFPCCRLGAILAESAGVQWVRRREMGSG